MKKVKHILAVFLHFVIPQDIYYPKLLHTRLQFSLTYYLVIISCFAALFTGIVFYQFSPIRMASYKDSIVEALYSFPDAAEITMRNGILESNQNKPLFLWIYHNSQPFFIFMIHTKDNATKTQFPYPVVFLGSDKAQFSYWGKSMTYPYDPSWKYLVSKINLQSVISTINRSFPSFAFFFYFFLFLFVPLTFIVGSTVLLLIASLLVFALLYTFIPHIHLKKCIQAGMHGTHVPFFILILLTILFPTALSGIIITSSLVFVFSLVATYEMYSKEISHSKGR